MTIMEDVPKSILDKIRADAVSDWPDDTEMQDWTIENEIEAYRRFAAQKFHDAANVREQLLTVVEAYFSSWEERADFLDEELKSYRELSNLAEADICKAELTELRKEAAEGHDWFSEQLTYVREGIERIRYVRSVRARIEPRRELIKKMEIIIGAECFNGYIRNYGPGGVWKSEGRSFRYPITFVRPEGEEKRHSMPDELRGEELITGFYKFGANDLAIVRALAKVVDMLEEEYGVTLTGSE